MVITKDKVVSVSYQLRTSENGNIVEQTSEGNPLTFLFGHNNMLAKFEDNLSGLKLGDQFNFMLVCTDAYGKSSPEAVVEIPVSAFEVEGQVDNNMLFIGNTIPMMDNKGNRFNGVVKEIKEQTVLMDFNHPMADQDLYFSGEVVEIREATSEELAHGHVHQGCSHDKENCDSHSHGCSCH